MVYGGCRCHLVPLRTRSARRLAACPSRACRSESLPFVAEGFHQSVHEGVHTLFFERLVGAPRFELGTPCTPCKCATRLRHAPTRLFLLGRTRAPAGDAARLVHDTPFFAARGRQRRSTFISSSSSTRTCFTICWLCVTSVRASSPPSLLRAPPMVKPWS